MFDSTEQRISDQARAIRKNGWLSELELEMTRRRIEQEGEESHEMENDARSADMDQNVADNVEGGLENGQNVDFVVNETEEIPPEERTIIDQIREIIAEGAGNNHGYSFKKVDKKRLEEETRKVNKAIKYVATRDITESNNLIKVAGIWVSRQLGLKKPMRGKKVEPWWKRRIEGDITRIRREVNILEREKQGEIKSK